MVEFRVSRLVVGIGDSVAAVGGALELGSWDPQRGLVLEWGENFEWTARAKLPAGETRFKVPPAWPWLASGPARCCSLIVSACRPVWEYRGML
jgi:hypothetical protein